MYRILLDGNLFAYAMRDHIVVGGINNGMYTITIDPVDFKEKSIARARGDTYVFNVNLTGIEMNILKPAHNELISGGDVVIDLDVRGIKEEEKGNYMFAIGWNNATETKIYNNSLADVTITNLPSGIHNFMVVLLDKNCAPLYGEDGKIISQNISFGYFIDKTEEKRRSDRNVMDQLDFLDKITKSKKFGSSGFHGEISKKFMIDDKASEDGKVTAIRYHKERPIQGYVGKPPTDTRKEDDNPSTSADRIKCRIINGQVKKSLTVDGNARVSKVYNYMVKQQQGNNHKKDEIVLLDNDDYEIDLNDYVRDYSNNGIAYFKVRQNL